MAALSMFKSLDVLLGVLCRPGHLISRCAKPSLPPAWALGAPLGVLVESYYRLCKPRHGSGVYCTGKAAICIALVAKYSSFAGIFFWLVVSHIFYFPFHIWDVILPIDFHIFQRGRYTTNQFLMRSILRHWNQCICGMLRIFGSGCGSQTWTYTQVHMLVLCEWFQ